MTKKVDIKKDIEDIILSVMTDYMDDSDSTLAEATKKMEKLLDLSVSEAVSEFAKKVEDEVIGEDEDIVLDLHQPNAKLIQRFNLYRNQLRNTQRQSLQLLVKKT